MKLTSFFKIMSVVTMLALTYVHMQMKIMDLAYRGNRKVERIKGLIEENGGIKYKILTLKSANNLGAKMLEKDSDMRFADVDDVVQIAASLDFLNEKSSVQAELTKQTNPLVSFLSLITEAEAKTEE